MRWILHNQISLGVPLEHFVVNNFLQEFACKLTDFKFLSYQHLLSYFPSVLPRKSI